MAMRLRKIKSNRTKCGWKWVALCAVAYPAKDGDVYLDDAQDHAIREKLWKDWKTEED